MVKIDNLLGGSVMDEFVRLSLEKGWIINKEGQTPAELAKKFEQYLAQTGKSVPSKGEAYDRAFQDYLSNVYQPKWLHKPQTFEAKPVKIQQQKARSKPKYQKSILIQEVQKALNRFSKAKDYGFALKEDAVWGPNTAKAWNLFVEDEGAGKLPKVDEHGRNLPHKNVLLWAMNQYVPKAAAKSATTAATSKKDVNKEAAMSLTPQQKTIVQRTMELRDLSFGDALAYVKTKYPRLFSEKPLPEPEKRPEIKLPTWMIEDPYERMVAELPKHKPESLMGLEKAPEESAEKARKEVLSPMRVIPGYADDGVATVATVINELVSLANDLESMGEVEAAGSVDKQIVLYKEAADKLYDVTGEKGEDLINQAHPGGGPTLVPAAEEGGKVETIVEEHKKVVDKATKQPTGKYAEMMNKLVATANLLEKEGDTEAAKIVDKTIASLHRKLLEQDPFVNRGSANEAAGSEEKTASVKKEGQTGEGLYDIILRLNRALRTMESKIQDQTNEETMFTAKPQGFLISNPFPGGDADPNAEYDEFIVGAYRRMASYLRKANELIKRPERLMRLKRDADLIEKTLKKMKGFYEYAEAAEESYSGSWSAPGYEQWGDAYNELKVLVSKVVPKKEDPREKEKAFKNYLGTINSLIKVITANQEYFSEKLGGAKVTQQMISILRKEETDAKRFNTAQLKSKNSRAWKLLKVLERAAAAAKQGTVATIQTTGLTKIADNIDRLTAIIQKKLAPPAKKRPTRRRGRERAPAAAKDPQVKALQQAMVAAGFDVGKHRDDGVWGKDTASAYNQMMAKIKTLVPRLKPPVVTDKEPADLARIVGLGQRVAAYLQKVAPAVEGEFEFKGKTINLKALQSPEAFVNELRLQGLFDPNSEHDDRPAEILQEMYAAIQPEKIREAMELESPGKYGQIVAMMQRLYNQLAGGWKKSAPRIPGTKAPEAPAAPPASSAGTSGKPGGTLARQLSSLGIPPEHRPAADELRRKIDSLPRFEIINSPRWFASTVKSGKLRGVGGRSLPRDPFAAVDALDAMVADISADLNNNAVWMQNIKELKWREAFNHMKSYAALLHELKTSLAILQKQAPSGNPYVRY